MFSTTLDTMFQTASRAMFTQIRIERNLNEPDAQRDNVNVFVETSDGLWWGASFATVSFLQRQMFLSRDIASDMPHMAPVRFMTIETPHVIVENLMEDTIEDTVNNLMALGTFESVFMPCLEEQFIREKVAN